MSVFSYSIRTIFRRPIILLVFGIIMLAACLINYYNPIYSVIYGFGGMGISEMLNSVVPFLNLVTGLIDTPLKLIEILIAGAAIITVLSLLIAIGFAGIFNVIKNIIEGKPKHAGEFSEGLKKYYSRMFSITFRVLLMAVLLFMFLMVVCVPASILTRAYLTTRPDLMFLAVIVDIITVFTLFFAVMFFCIYILFWYPAAVTGDRKWFSLGKRTADAAFWNVLGKVFLSGIVFSVYQLVLLYADNHLTAVGTSALSILLLLVTWAVNTLFVSFLATYIFTTFKSIQMKSQNSI
ncbi:MAG: hypothetical protein Q8920_17050 [Bacillota bacterium]|nr:hypothetical protein [Bacillota bacterium]